MKGLMIKDFKMMRHDSAIGFLVPVLFFVISLIGHNDMYFAGFSVMMFTLVPTLNIATDEKYKWDKYEAVLPIKKEHIVLEKYIMIFLFILPVIVIEALLFCLIKSYSANEVFRLISSLLLFGLLSPAVILPLYYLFGYNTSRIAGVPASVIIYSVFTAINLKGHITDGIDKYELLAQINAPANLLAAILITAVSILLSIIIYKRKEF